MYIQPKIKRFQEGGQMEPEMEQPAEQGGGEQNPLIMLAQAAAQGLQNQDCQIMAQVCQGLLQLVQQATGGEQSQGEPVYKKGGVLLRRIIR